MHVFLLTRSRLEERHLCDAALSTGLRLGGDRADLFARFPRLNDSLQAVSAPDRPEGRVALHAVSW